MKRVDRPLGLIIELKDNVRSNVFGNYPFRRIIFVYWPFKNMTGTSFNSSCRCDVELFGWVMNNTAFLCPRRIHAFPSSRRNERRVA